MNKVRELRKDENSVWDDFVFSHSLGCIYHTSLWRRVIEGVYRHKPLYLVLEDNSQKVTAGLPFFIVKSKITSNRLTSLPCAQSCNPLVSRQDEYESLLKFALEFINLKKLRYIELKTNQYFEQDSTEFGDVISGYSSYTLDLQDDLESIKNKFHKSCIRRKIKKFYQTGFELIIGDSLQDVKIFYDLYLKMRKHYGMLPQPYKFFEVMWKILSEKNCIEILHAKYRGHVISSILLLMYKSTVIYEYGASRNDKMHLSRIFLLWEAIKQSKSKGYKAFDFGRTSDDNAGLSQFKRRWNTKREQLHYYFIPKLGGLAYYAGRARRDRP